MRVRYRIAGRHAVFSIMLAFGLAVCPNGCNRSDKPEPGAADVAGSADPTAAPKPLFDSIGGSHTGTSSSNILSSGAAPSGDAKPTDDATIPCFEMVDIAADSGIDFIYKTGARGESLMVETMGGGCGVLDIDNDGLWDLFICQGGDPSVADPASQPPPALYRNFGEGKFVDVVAEAIGDGGLGYCQGLVVGDYDGDGFDDVYVTSVGTNRLLRNRGDGTFRDVTDEAGVGDTRWSSSAAFADLDGDGRLDLYVCNYVVYDPLNPLDCRNRDGEPRICHPREMAYFPNECFINRGDGTFSAEAAERGLDGPGSKSLGVAVADFTGDGLPDVYVANDTTANFLFVNQGDGKFKEKALAFGCAVNQEGMYEAGMGLAVADYDNDGFSDIYCTHFHEESNTLYRNQGGRGFRDVTALVGLHKPALPRLGFGTVMQDLNADGACDIFVTNGHIENYPGNPIHAMRPQLFTFLGRSWRDCSDQGGEFFKRKLVGRGVALVDPTGKGIPDVVVVHQDSPAALLTTPKTDGNWLNVNFIGDDGNRRGIGCRVTVTSGDKKWFKQLVGGGSYGSSHQPTLFFGLGKKSGPCRVTVVWPDDRRQTLDGVKVGQRLTVLQRDAA